MQDTDDMTVAVVLNRQTQKAASFKGDDTEKRRLIFFGGEFDAGGNRVMWLTANDAMRERGLGTVVSPANRDSGQEGEVSELDPGVVISRCSGEEAVEAINRKIATADDFLLVRGFQLWPKGAAAMQVSEAQAFKGLSVAEGALQAEIDLGRMEEVPGLSKEIWQQLLALATPGDDKDAPVELGVSAWQASAPAPLPHPSSETAWVLLSLDRQRECHGCLPPPRSDEVCIATWPKRKRSSKAPAADPNCSLCVQTLGGFCLLAQL